MSSPAPPGREASSRRPGHPGGPKHCRAQQPGTRLALLDDFPHHLQVSREPARHRDGHASHHTEAGTTRRAAKMVVVDVDHPDIEQYIDWKVKEEQKVAALVTGSKINQKHLKAVLKACVNCEGSGDDCFSPEKNPALKREIKLARRNHVPDNFIKRVIQFAKQGYTDIDFPIYDTDWDSEA